MTRRVLIGIATLAAAACGGGAGSTTVTAADYRFENLPATVRAGTTMSLRNSSPTEIHDMLLVKLADGEQRSAEALARLPDAQLDGLLSGSTVGILLAPPAGAELIRALGDGKLTEKGRYLVICRIPMGADSATFLAATRGRGNDLPTITGGPSHAALGMYGEIRVE